MVYVFIFYFDSAQHLIPLGGTFCRNFFQTAVAYFLEILLCLFDADKRRSDTGVDYSCRFAETNHTTGMLTFRLELVAQRFAVRYGSGIGKRLVECDDKIIFEILGYASTILCRIPDDFSF